MTRNDMNHLMRLRRELTGESFNDATIDAWLKAYRRLNYSAADEAMIEAAKHGRVTLATFTAALHQRTPRPYDIEPPAADDAGPHLTRERIAQLVADGIVQGRAERAAARALDPILAERWAHFQRDQAKDLDPSMRPIGDSLAGLVGDLLP